MPPTTPDIKTLVQGFASHIRELKAPEYKESQVRLHYIDPFWTLLGWDVQNKAQRAPQDVEVIVEPSMDSVDDEGLRARQPDYLFRVHGFARFVVEAKKPSVDLDADRHAIFQAKRYAWSAAIPFAILTDFEQFRLYDTTLKPSLNDPARGRIEEFALDFQHYPEQWDVLVQTFGREAVADGSLEALRARIRKVPAGRRLRTVDRMLIDLKGDEPIDRDFLAYLDAHRRHFAREIYRQNRKSFPDADTLHGAARLTEAVQRVMDRLVFMRVCEDRGISEWGGLRAILERIGREGGDLYAALCRRFRELDRSYNGYLFKPHPVSEALDVDGNLLADFIRTLYPPEGPWDFSAIADDILGIVYERFLGNVVTVKGHHVEVEQKPEVRHAGGVYYTPRFVVDTIIRRVVGPMVAGKTPQQVLDVKILDPACGSGSFLVAAFQFLIDHCTATIAADPSLASVPATPKARSRRKEIAFRNGKGQWQLAPDFKAALLTNCLHGVDIDQQAVEVTVMSLYLKMLEGALPPNWQREWLENELLPPLDNNVQCGNSLIDSADFDRYVVEKYGGLFPMDEDLRFRINRFDWTSRTRGFGRLLDAQAVEERGRSGFDCIIGNPPYVRVQELNKWAPQECEFYKWNYRSAARGNYDIYVVFTEKCLSLLSSDGLLGFIMPHKFWQARYGEGLRKVIADGKHLKAVIDFGDQQVFKGGTTYTAVHVLSRAAGASSVDYAKIIELDDGRTQCADLDAGKRASGSERFKARNPDGAGPWVFCNATVAKWLDAVRAEQKPLGEIAQKIAQGLVTSCDEVYFLNRHGKLYHSDATDRTYELERAVVHPLLKGSVHVKRWLPVASDRAVLFPYEKHRGGWRTIPEDKFQARYPLAWAYLLKNRERLESRESGKMAAREDWYAYVYPKNLEVMGSPKVLVPAIARSGQYCLDAKGEFHFVGSGGGGGGGYGIVTDAVDLYYLCGLLNSKCLDTFLQKVTTPFHSGWFAYSKMYLAQIPIKLPSTAEDKKLAGRIVESVRAIMDAKARLRAPASPFSGVKGGLKRAVLSDRETVSLEREVEAHEKRIDDAVFALYGVEGSPE